MIENNCQSIEIINATENNLKSVCVKIPLSEFTCVIGPSGCGKSSLVYDTIFAESQRFFLESMSGNLYGQKLMDKPKVEKIRNLRPALNLSQNYYNVNPRSTVGTVSDVSYYLRSLYALMSNEINNTSYDANFFSANNPSSCCEKCKGLGEEYVLSEDAIIPDPNKTLANGGILYYKGAKTSLEYKLLEAECEYYGIDIEKKVSELTSEEKYQLLYRKEKVDFSLKYKTPKGRYKQKIVTRKGAIEELKEIMKSIDKSAPFSSISKYLIKVKCSQCDGNKLKKDILNIKINKKNIAETEDLSLEDLLLWLNSVENSSKNYICKEQIKQLIFEIRRRVENIVELKLEYLTLGRTVPTLSGGEIQRVRLANQLTCPLGGIIYILDEPCKGLHYSNINSVIEATRIIVEKGNTVIAIEHNKQYISEAKKIIELGPVGGPEGGYIVSESSSQHRIPYDVSFKKVNKINDFFELRGISFNNLKSIDVKIPYGKITCLSGVSGSGKTSLASVVAECCDNQKAINCVAIYNCEKIKKVIRVNQQPIGKTPRSTVVSYLGIYDMIRDLYANTKEAKRRAYSASMFSMNIEGGRCECCQGTGKKKIELTFLPDSYVVCPECKGRRFRDEILEIKYKGLNINDVLNKSIKDIMEIFIDSDNIYSILSCMKEIGMDYICLGQMSMNLSGGEAQRIKLAKCLGIKSNGKNLYILDEPTAGLSSKDIKLLEKIFVKLSNLKETIIIIEHNIEFIASIADYLVDLGTIAGNKGGTTVLQGFPKDVIKDKKSSWEGIENYLKIEL